MGCEQIERQLGRYIDGELSDTERDRIATHLASCGSCRAECDALLDLAQEIAKGAAVGVPESLWSDIARRLDQPIRIDGSPSPRKHRSLMPATRWALAAGLLLAVGMGLVGLSSLDTSAHASSVDFGVLLDALPLDAQGAFRKFLVRYDGKPTTPAAAKRLVPGLNFDTPALLPGGFRLTSVYRLRIGKTIGIAAAYDRDGEFLAVVFHTPMKHERFGSHESYPCVIGKHGGHKVQVGDWKLVHLTDRTTCHCLLSRLDEQTEMPAVMKAIAPGSPQALSNQPDSHP